jgi:hypothetical protein
VTDTKDNKNTGESPNPVRISLRAWRYLKLKQKKDVEDGIKERSFAALIDEVIFGDPLVAALRKLIESGDTARVGGIAIHLKDWIEESEEERPERKKRKAS